MTSAEKLNQKVENWLYDDNVDNTIAVDDRAFRLEYNGDIYSIWENNKRIGWNDNHKDFRNIGYFVFG
jgi:hypothetical protein